MLTRARETVVAAMMEAEDMLGGGCDAFECWVRVVKWTSLGPQGCVVQLLFFTILGNCIHLHLRVHGWEPLLKDVNRHSNTSLGLS